MHQAAWQRRSAILLAVPVFDIIADRFALGPIHAARMIA
jgi:hypothetical protein